MKGDPRPTAMSRREALGLVAVTAGGGIPIPLRLLCAFGQPASATSLHEFSAG
jgi:hypothetical protein